MSAAAEARQDARGWLREAIRWLRIARAFRGQQWRVQAFREALRYVRQCRRAAHSAFRRAQVSR